MKSLIFNVIFFVLIYSVHLTISSSRNRRAAIWTESQRWTNGTIPYIIDKKAFKGEEIVLIHDAINTWMMETCINFRIKNDKDKNWINITGGSNCESLTGMADMGEQIVKLNSPLCSHYGTYLHELGHVLGLHHEHQHPRRDDHVIINEQNIKPHFRSFYEKVHFSEIENLDIPYDFQSIMHYGSKSFSDLSDRPSLELKNKTLNILEEVYNKDLSFYDAKAINIHYECSRLCDRDIFCPEYGYVDQFCQCHTPKSFALRRCLDKNDKGWCKEKEEQGYCEFFPVYMSFNCRKTCDKCYKHKFVKKKSKEVCKNFDKNSKCEVWAKMGECVKNVGYMKIKCKKSCGLCREHNKYTTTLKPIEVCENRHGDRECNKLAKEGECLVDELFMDVNCAKACGKCYPIVTERPCGDSLSMCQLLKKAGKCETNYNFMHSMCKKSCGFCDTELSTKKVKEKDCTDYKDDLSCSSWTKAGICKSDKENMLKYCKKSCGFCKEFTGTAYTAYTFAPVSDLNCKNIYDDKKCDSHKSEGDCIKNPELMSLKCAKSCGDCLNFKANNASLMCKDLEQEKACKQWQRFGKCKTITFIISEQCFKTCNFCEDRNQSVGCRNLEDDKKCQNWSKNDNCSQNANFMMVHCAKTCGRCTNDRYVECSNLYSDKYCNILKQIGQCYTNPQFMLKQCSRSCGSCDLMNTNISDFICSNVLHDKFCALWKIDGECQKSRKFMMKNCGKSCGTCQKTNSENMCTAWKYNGLCKTNTSFMNITCPKTCKNKTHCADVYNHKGCLKWKEEKMCDKNYQFMKTFCSATCGFCSKISLSCPNLLDDKQCVRLAKNKECHTNPSYMLTMCSKTCKNCTVYRKLNRSDTSCRNRYDNITCDMWSKKDECRKNPKYMLINCAKSCGNCQPVTKKIVTKKTTLSVVSTTRKPKAILECENLYEDIICEKWKNKGHCERNAAFMALQCRKTCEGCNKTLECKNAHDDQSCEKWVRQGKCNSKMKFMFMMCVKSCGKCSLLDFKIDDLWRNSSKRCEDKYGEISCESLKEIGECERNPIFMTEQCTKSCGKCSKKSNGTSKSVTCKNFYGDKVCDEWARNGECKNGQSFISNVCSKSCRTCSSFGSNSTEDQPCIDLEEVNKCLMLKNKGECQSNRNQMGKICAKSCGMCSGNFMNIQSTVLPTSKNCVNIYGDKQCSYWARQNQCERNFSFMKRYCSKVCNQCGKRISNNVICEDKYSKIKCQQWAERGECHLNHIWMNENCSYSCKVCTKKSDMSKILES